MQNYLSLLKDVESIGEYRDDRTGVGAYSLFGRQLRFDLAKGFPIVTTKKVHWKSVVGELLWFLKGSGNTSYLKENGITIWDEWADTEGDLGPVYGVQWRSWKGSGIHIDQIANLIKDLKENPMSRRHIVSAWNVAELTSMALPPCHMMFQCFVSNSKGTPTLSMQMYQRSADIFLGVPFNIASYALLLHILAREVDMIPGELIITFGDLHMYKNHAKQVEEQLQRIPHSLPHLKFTYKNLDEYTIDDFKLDNYHYHPSIKAPVAV